ncbi:prepilin peptidase [Micromonospora sp. NPDC049275]|uniref:prepilin peptidase n=1 Tax=Micromonospora sp. NPDC049275 TaxID=3364268 RepID=UPI0037205261
MTGPVLWCAALIGALAGLTMPDAYVRIMTTLTAPNAQPSPSRHTHHRPHASRPAQRTLDALASGIAMAAAFTGMAWLLGDRPDGLLLVATWATVLYAGTLLAAVDVATRRLPTPIIGIATLAIGIILTAHALATGQAHTLTTAALAGGALGGGYLLLALITTSQMGLGDVRLAVLLGTSLGVIGWPAVFLGAALPYALAVPEALTRLLLRRQPDIAFGPYMLAGAVLSAALSSL